ncbi:MAG TPA: WD40 repeat domain-containing protein, partial [Myxococcaceae bacterium]|nr:WD40 repeat domain-containing protein [Myxococcaceae bacterium]
MDLRSRSIRGTFHYANGLPRLAFSLDGQRVFAAGMNDASLLSGWRLPAEDIPKTPRWWTWGVLSESGRTALLFNFSSGRYELYRPPEKLVASGVGSLGIFPRLVGDGPAVAFISNDASAVGLHDLENHRAVWQHPCRLCKDISVSEDGSRLVQVGADGLEVWDTRTDQRLFQETRVARPLPRCSISRDGRRVVWSAVERAFVRDLDSGRELTLPLDGALLAAQFSPDSNRLASITTRSTSVWEAATGRAMWSAANDVPNYVILRWSPDGRRLLVGHGFSATEVLDAGSGERLASFQALRRVVTPVVGELYSPDL